MLSVSPSSPWPALVRGTLKLINLIVIPKPAFTFPDSNPTTTIPVYRTTQRNAMGNLPSTPVNYTALSLFEQSQSMSNTSHRPMSSTPHRPDPWRNNYHRSSSQIEKEGCCCECHNLSTSQGRVQGSALSLESWHSPRSRRVSIASQSFCSPSPRSRRQTELFVNDPAQLSTPTPSPISNRLNVQARQNGCDLLPLVAITPPKNLLQEYQRHRSTRLMRRNKLTKPRPKHRKSRRWGRFTSMEVAVADKLAMRKSGNLNSSLIANDNGSSGDPVVAEGPTRRQSLRRSKRIVSLPVDGARIGSVSGNQSQNPMNGSNDKQEESMRVVEPQPLSQHSVSPKKPQGLGRSRSRSSAGQSRYFELELSPIIEDVRAFNPPHPLALAPSPIIKGEGTPTHSSSDDMSPRSCSSFGDVLVIAPKQTGPQGHTHTSSFRETPLMHPRSLLIDLSQGSSSSYGCEVSERRASSDEVGGVATLIPAVILTSPTPDLSNGSPVFSQYDPNTVLAEQGLGLERYPHPQQHVFERYQQYQRSRGPHVIPTSGSSGLGLTLDYVVDEMGVVEPQPRAACDGDGRGGIGESEGQVMGQDYARPRSYGATSGARTALFRTGDGGSGRARRAWGAVSKFFSIGRERSRSVPLAISVAVSATTTTGKEGDSAPVTDGGQGRQRLDLSSGPAKRRWFGPLRHMHTANVRFT